MSGKPRAPRISVVMPAYNAEAYLSQAIDSVVSQVGADFELILVDDGSTDSTARIAREYGDRLNYYYRENGGVAEALNTGIAQARGEYVALVGADDVLEPTSLAERQAILDRFPEAAFVHTGAWEIDEAGRVLRLRTRRTGGHLYEPPSQAFRRLLDGNWIVASTVMVRRGALEKTGGFNQTFVPGEDWAMWLQLASRGGVAYIPAPLARYRIHSASLVGRLPLEAYEVAHGRVLRELFDNGSLGPLAIHRKVAYAAHQRRMALMAAYNRSRRKFLPYFLRSLWMRPKLVLEAETWKTVYFGCRLLVPGGVLQILKSLRRPVRSGAGRRADHASCSLDQTR